MVFKVQKVGSSCRSLKESIPNQGPAGVRTGGAGGSSISGPGGRSHIKSRKARLHSQSNEKLLKDSKMGGTEGVCVFTLAGLWGIDWWGWSTSCWNSEEVEKQEISELINVSNP